MEEESGLRKITSLDEYDWTALKIGANDETTYLELSSHEMWFIDQDTKNEQ